MQNITKLLLGILLLSSTATAAPFKDKITSALKEHYQHNKDLEYFSGAELSIALPKQAIQNYYIGNISHDSNSAPISANTLFEIGSITKSFTAAVMLQLENENKLHLNETIKNKLPQYNKWSDATIKQLLNMSSGLPNYSDTPLWNTEQYKNPDKIWTNKELIDFVYPTKFNPPLKTNYFYSNTGYLLASLITEQLTKQSFQTELTHRTIQKAALSNTFYQMPTPSKDIQNRLAHGYNFNQYDNPSLVGYDFHHGNTSWCAAAGGIISNSEDIAKWVKALFIDNTILNSTSKKELMQLVSTSSGQPIAKTDEKETHGFGLGVSQAYDKDIGRFWYYEGQTLGYRAMYMYTPCNGVIISSIFNSATNSENDHAGPFMKKVYQLIVSEYPELNCKT
jgi:D-alanyl-D-alanine carboxypeptidase